jgi:hypothetical protein
MPTRAAMPVLAALVSLAAVAGPPFRTDDPVPTQHRHFELYTYGLVIRAQDAEATQAPAVELDWGAARNLQLTVAVPFAGKFAPVGAVALGPGDVVVAAKYRFVTETSSRPQIAVSPAVAIPSGNAMRDLGNGKLLGALPVWLQKSFGPWTTYGGGGAVVNQTRGGEAFPFGGWVLEREITKKLALGGELFAHGSEGGEIANRGSSLMFDFGGHYRFSPRFSILFAGGHSVAGHSETYGYLALHWTWGPNP